MLILGYICNGRTLIRNVDGALHVGQSTYGDLCLHLGIATRAEKRRPFPPTYTLLPGARLLCYPFLADSHGYLHAADGHRPLPSAFVVTGTSDANAGIRGVLLFRMGD